MAFDQTDPVDLAVLKAEVINDPLGLGYDYTSGATQVVLDNLNEKRAQFTVRKPKISTADVRSNTTYAAYNALQADAQEWLRWMTGSSGLGQEDLLVTDDLILRLADSDGDGTGSIWNVSQRTAMNAAMGVLIDVNGSRAEDLFGYGTVISKADWIAARDS